mmetsp:Transcript_36664/g.6568  ORF Transcript_36664/g.6568 Transcript_36664/m.6568 type:complete len:84 (+) Transcript_36664:252-503(+)
MVFNSSGDARQSPNIVFRKKLKVYADVIHAYNIQGLKSIHENVNVVIIRENMEGEYSGLEHEVYPGVVESIKVTTAKASEKIA